MVAFNSGDPSSNPAEVSLQFFFKIVVEKNEKKLTMDHVLIIFRFMKRTSLTNT